MYDEENVGSEEEEFDIDDADLGEDLDDADLKMGDDEDDSDPDNRFT
jgi:hypothetical protein